MTSSAPSYPTASYLAEHNPQALKGPPYYYSVYGPDANCTLAVCPASISVYSFRPSITANGAFLALFAFVGLLHLGQAAVWRSWWYSILIAIGCVSEVIGYAGRIWMWYNPFSFQAFLIQIILVTFAPVFMTAAIYITLAKTVLYLAPDLARFPPKYYYYIFIPCDVISLALQAAGGGLSSSSSGSSSTADDVSIAGLAFQVATIVVFMALATDFAWTYLKHSSSGSTGGGLVRNRFSGLSRRFTVFAVCLTLGTVFILIRCCYRIAELREGYRRGLVKNQGLFIALEGVMVVVATFLLLGANPAWGIREEDAVGRGFGKEAEEAKGDMMPEDRA